MMTINHEYIDFPNNKNQIISVKDQVKNIRYSDFFKENEQRVNCSSDDALLRKKIVEINSLCLNKDFKLLQIDSFFLEVDIDVGFGALKKKLERQNDGSKSLAEIIVPLINIIKKRHIHFNCSEIKKKFIIPLINDLEREIFINLWERRKILLLCDQKSETFSTLPQDVHFFIIKIMLKLTYP